MSRNFLLAASFLAMVLFSQSTMFAQDKHRERPMSYTGELPGLQMLLKNDRLYAVLKSKRGTADNSAKDFAEANLVQASWAYRSDSYLRVYDLEEEARNDRPLVRAKFLTQSTTEPNELIVAGSEVAASAKFQPRLVEKNLGLVKTDGIISYTVKYELWSEGKPSGKFLGHADNPPEFAEKVQQLEFLRQVMLVDQDKAAVFRFRQDLGTSGK